MTRVKQHRWSRGPVWVLALVLLSTAGCSRPTGVPTEGATEANQAPFQDHGGSPGNVDSHDSSPSGTSVAVGPNGLPFNDSQNVPAGTLLSVRLEGPINTSAAGGTPFEAIIDQPVVVDGNTLIPRGAAAGGRIQSAGVSKVNPSRGYVRLALETVHLGGQDVQVQTASLFAREVPQDDEAGSTIRLEKGRRLTFRLTQGVFLTNQRAQATP